MENKNNNLEYKILELTTLLRKHGIVNKTNKKPEESKDVNDDNEEERNPSVVPDKEGTTSNSAENKSRTQKNSKIYPYFHFSRMDCMDTWTFNFICWLSD